LRQKLLNSLGIKARASRSKLGASPSPVPKILYVDRQASSRLQKEDHLALLGLLAGLLDRGAANTVAVQLDEILMAKQVELFADAEVRRKPTLTQLLRSSWEYTAMASRICFGCPREERSSRFVSLTASRLGLKHAVLPEGFLLA
jgi:hypothetical protein